MATPRALAYAVVCFCLAASGALLARQPGPATVAQTFDQPYEGARSSRNASYDIEARLDPAARRITGRVTLHWRNISSRSTRELQFHLYWNAWRNERSTFMRERRLGGSRATPRADAWGSIDVTRIELTGADGAPIDLTRSQRFIAPDDGNAHDRTVMAVALPREVAPLETVHITLEWRAVVPRPFARTGVIGESFFIAQWFPKVGVLEDDGWNTHQFHAATEFYADFGSYDVRLSVPRGFVLGASGRQMTRSDTTDTSTYWYRADDIHDFAWTTSPTLVERQRTFDRRGLPRVDIRLLLQPERVPLADRYFAITEATLQRYGEWFGPYPYDHLTVVDPAYQGLADGMEYPTLVTGRARWLAPPTVQVPEMTTAHEVGHQWWYGLVATNEFEHAWMDEGINTYATARLIDEAFRPNQVEMRYFGGFVPWVFPDLPFTRLDNDRLTGYRDNAGADAQATPTFRAWPSTSTFITYNKTALWLHTLERMLGWPVMQRILSTYFERWKFRHPRPDDFFAIVNEVSGRDLTWFLRQVHGGAATFDYGIQDLQVRPAAGGGQTTTVVVRRYGEATFPVEVVTTFADGTEAREQWDGEARRVIYTYDRPVRALSAVVDPARVLLLDVNYANNSVMREPRAGEAARKWSLKWLGWLQDLLLTYAFLV